MVTASAAVKKFGNPGGRNEGTYMTTWAVPKDIQDAFAHVRFSALGTLGFPKRIYCNRLLQPNLERALRNLIAAGRNREMTTWDGCYIIRNARGLSSWSLHA
jgi:hypothetical protein